MVATDTDVQNDKSTYPELECPVCDRLCKPWKLTKKLEVVHRCNNKDEHPDSHPTVSWKIAQNGEMTQF